MHFPSSARYDRATRIAHEFLLEDNITSFPIDPFTIIDNYKWGLITYTELAEKHRVSITQVVKAYQSEDGFTVYDSGVNYTIAYNDTIRSEGRIRFTLMHEIGHILLTHFVDFKETILMRSSLSGEKYNILERETNVFARNTLSPFIVVDELKLTSKADIIYYFRISQKAADTRLKCLGLDFKNTTFSTTRDLLRQFTNFIFSTRYSNHCNQCGYFFVYERAKYCPICGHSKLLKRGVKKMKYSGYKLDENGRACICPKCENEETSLGDNCIICGTGLINKCAQTNISYDNGYDEYSQSCDTVAPGNARYCYNCGNETTFFQSGFLKSWDDKAEELKIVVSLNDEIPF
jgi:Zn-dependent peptidase ImmA (M78 family)/RNA polymerase subunit RPABC4/transcription elongation factor Spt4